MHGNYFFVGVDIKQHVAIMCIFAYVHIRFMWTQGCVKTCSCRQTHITWYIHCLVSCWNYAVMHCFKMHFIVNLSETLYLSYHCNCAQVGLFFHLPPWRKPIWTYQNTLYCHWVLLKCWLNVMSLFLQLFSDQGRIKKANALSIIPDTEYSSFSSICSSNFLTVFICKIGYVWHHGLMAAETGRCLNQTKTQ